MNVKLYLIFETTRKVIVAERECLAKGYKCLAVPVPREFSSKCGIALEIDQVDEYDILNFLEEFNIKPMKYKKNVSGKTCKVD